MKKFVKMIAPVLVLCLLLTVAGCTSKGDVQSSSFITQENLAKESKPEGSMAGKEGASFDLNFGVATTFNTVVLKENGANITEFSIQIINPETASYETIYTQDEMGAYRYCAFDKVTTTGLRVLISGATEKFKITDIEVYNINHLIDENETDFRVTSYILADAIFDKASLDKDTFNTITDVILFGVNIFDESGKISYQDKEINGKMIPGKEVFDTALANLREVIGERDIEIHVNFLGPDTQTDSSDWEEQMKDKGNRHTKAFKDGGLAKYIGQFVKDHQLDGAFFDYEYPLKRSHAKAYSKFLVAMKQELGDKKLGAALSDWNLNLTAKAFDSLDMIEVMAYDLFDERGNHSNFNQSIGTIANFKKKGIDMSKLDLGIPFYGRPADKAAYWYPFKDESAALGQFKNYSSATTDKNGNAMQYSDRGRYYNSPQLVFDKSAFAMNYGLGGVMVWHYSCDLPYSEDNSLLRSIDRTVESRSK